MKSILVSVFGCVLCAFLATACGDADNPAGIGGGGLFCASDDSEVGDTIDCPSGTETIDFCIDSRSGNCFYEVGGEEVNCGNCFDAGNDLTNCAIRAVELCD